MNSLLCYSTNFEMSAEGIHMIKIHEGCLLQSYHDGEKYSIGYGHHDMTIEEGMVISQWKADQYLKDDIAWVNRELNHIVQECFSGKAVVIPQELLDAIGDMVYRCGGTTLRESEFYRRLMRCRVVEGQILQEDYLFTASAVVNFNVTNLGTQNRQQHLYALLVNKTYPVGKINYEKFVMPTEVNPIECQKDTVENNE